MRHAEAQLRTPIKSTSSSSVPHTPATPAMTPDSLSPSSIELMLSPLPPPPVEQKRQGKCVGNYAADFFRYSASTGTFLLIESQVQVAINNTVHSKEAITCTPHSAASLCFTTLLAHRDWRACRLLVHLAVGRHHPRAAGGLGHAHPLRRDPQVRCVGLRPRGRHAHVQLGLPRRAGQRGLQAGHFQVLVGDENRYSLRQSRGTPRQLICCGVVGGANFAHALRVSSEKRRRLDFGRVR